MKRVIVLLVILGVLVGVKISMPSPPEPDRNVHVQEIFKALLAKTGQSQDAIPLEIINSPTINAFTDGHRVVIFVGMLNFVQNDDELALVLGHELAHHMLKHTTYPEFRSNDLEVSVAEANADKMGAVYMMRAGFDVCWARQVWKRLAKMEGDYQGGDHPTFVYRYDQLNIGCE